ncbi:universal stress protein [Nonomuraea sp. NPDC004580]|uniref:universal stress protein n=1 Tax=Nonomuraea sp. NPDC004580 TaxID=3154552 RepID=UPI0033A184C1
MRKPGMGFVLVGYDESPGSEQALRWAVEEARLRGLAVVVCHAWNWPYPLRAVSRALLAEVERVAAGVVEDGVRRARALGGAPDVRPLLVKRPASAVLLEAAAEAELVVLGSRGVGGFEDLRVGSAAVQVPAHSPTPVIVVRPDDHTDDPPGTRPDEEAGGGRIVVGVDGSPASLAAFGFAVREAALRDGVVEAVCGWWDPCVWQGHEEPFVDNARMRAEAESGFRDVVGRLAGCGPDVPVTATFEAERPPRMVVESAKGATLLVVGRSHRQAGVLVGPVVQAALAEVRCPVAVTPPPN